MRSAKSVDPNEVQKASALALNLALNLTKCKKRRPWHSTALALNEDMAAQA